MSCGCCNRKKQEDYSWVREMAKKTAVLNDEMQVIYKDGNVYKFTAYEGFSGQIVEIISNI